MFINLEAIFNEAIDEILLEESFDFSGEEYDGMYPFATPVSVRGTITNETGIVYIRAEAVFTLSAVCDRCAQPFEREMNIPIEHILVSELNDEDNDEFIVVEGMRLDVRQLVSEDVFLSMPMRLLCSEDCKGLCSACGKNLNEGKCDCKKEIDPRLAGLLQFLED